MASATQVDRESGGHPPGTWQSRLDERPQFIRHDSPPRPRRRLERASKSAVTPPPISRMVCFRGSMTGPTRVVAVNRMPRFVPGAGSPLGKSAGLGARAMVSRMVRAMARILPNRRHGGNVGRVRPQQSVGAAQRPVHHARRHTGTAPSRS